MIVLKLEVNTSFKTCKFAKTFIVWLYILICNCICTNLRVRRMFGVWPLYSGEFMTGKPDKTQKNS